MRLDASAFTESLFYLVPIFRSIDRLAYPGSIGSLFAVRTDNIQSPETQIIFLVDKFDFGGWLHAGNPQIFFHRFRDTRLYQKWDGNLNKLGLGFAEPISPFLRQNIKAGQYKAPRKVMRKIVPECRIQRIKTRCRAISARKEVLFRELIWACQ